ncbi:YopX family protein [Halobacillus trueperi]|nr:YopX family protein [Halobacillus trueperi]
MRELKFRMWNEEEKEMIDGDALAFEEYAPLSHLLTQKGIMQFTGYKDGHGKEIYEGDIVQRIDDMPFTSQGGGKSYSSWEVKFEYGGWSFKSTEKSPAYSYPSFYSNTKYMEVIGNIYEEDNL